MIYPETCNFKSCTFEIFRGIDPPFRVTMACSVGIHFVDTHGALQTGMIHSIPATHSISDLTVPRELDNAHGQLTGRGECLAVQSCVFRKVQLLKSRVLTNHRKSQPIEGHLHGYKLNI